MRARVVLYNPKMDAVLLIHRIKNYRDYWVVPGGGRKNWETAKQTAIREISEELQIELSEADLHHLFDLNDQEEQQVFFLARLNQIKTPKISGEERDRSNSNNVYLPGWVAITELDEINLVPPELAKRIWLAIRQGK